MKFSVWEICCLVISFLAIFWVSSVYLFSPSFPSKLATLTKEEILNSVDNGDLLFLSGNTFAEKVIKFWHSSYYTHVAIIFKDERGVKTPTRENTLFVWESDVGQRTKDGPRIMKLVDKLDRWKGDKIGMIRKFHGIKPSTFDIVEIAKQYVDRGMDIDMISWFFSSFPESRIFKHLKSDKRMFCSELVAETLQNLGILKKDKHPASYTPQDFSVIIPKQGFYSFPVYFSF